MVWLVEYADNDVPPDGRVRRQFNTFYLGAPDQALVWQIAKRYIELIRQQHPPPPSTPCDRPIVRGNG
jgi:hypothetical protein